MPFPLTIAGTEVSGPSELVAHVTSGEVASDVAAAACVALLQETDARAVAHGARLAVALGDDVLAEAVLHALDTHDLGLLLLADPGESDTSVEDTLLWAASEVAGADDAEVRAGLLVRMRQAGLGRCEVRLLCRAGSADELARWLPGVLAEPVDDAGRGWLLERAAAGDEAASTVRSVLTLLRPHWLQEEVPDGP